MTLLGHQDIYCGELSNYSYDQRLVCVVIILSTFIPLREKPLLVCEGWTNRHLCRRYWLFSLLAHKR